MTSLINLKTDPDWFQVQEIDDGIFLIAEPEHVNSFLVCGKHTAALIDTGMGFCNIRNVVNTLTQTPVIVLNTHWHFDHVGGNHLFDSIGIAHIEKHLVAQHISSAQLVPAYINACLQCSMPFPKNFDPKTYAITGTPATFAIEEGNVFDLGGRTLRAISTPGHTRGCFSFLDSDTQQLFCGDLIYQSTLFVQYLDSNLNAYIDSLQKLLSLFDQIKGFLVSHGAYNFPKSLVQPTINVFQQIKSGIPPTQVQNEEGELVNLYDVNGIRVLRPREGTAGVNLFGLLD